MPMQYTYPGGTRKLEFWKIGEHQCSHSAFVFVPDDWNDESIKDELEDWGSQFCSTSDFSRYGWNDEADFGKRE